MINPDNSRNLMKIVMIDYVGYFGDSIEGSIALRIVVLLGSALSSPKTVSEIYFNTFV